MEIIKSIKKHLKLIGLGVLIILAVCAFNSLVFAADIRGVSFDSNSKSSCSCNINVSSFGNISGNGANTQLAVFNGAKSIGSSEALTWDGTTLKSGKYTMALGTDTLFNLDYGTSGNELMDIILKAPLDNSNIRIYPDYGDPGYGRLEIYGGTELKPRDSGLSILGGVTDVESNTVIVLYDDGNEPPNALKNLMVGDIVALDSAPSVWAIVTSVSSNTSFTVDRNLGAGTAGQHVMKQSAMMSFTNRTGGNRGWIGPNGEMYLLSPINAPNICYANGTNSTGGNCASTTLSGINPFNQILNTSSSVMFYNIFNLTYLRGINQTAGSITRVYNGSELTSGGIVSMTGNVLLWHLNNQSGENETLIKDFSIYSINATCAGTACPTTVSGEGLINKTKFFDRSQSDVVKTVHDARISLTGNLTLSAWYKMNDSSTQCNFGANVPNLVGKMQDFKGYALWLRQSSGCKVSAAIGDGAWRETTAVAIPDGDWHNYLMTYNGTHVTLFIDGTYNVSLASGYPVATTGNGFVAFAHYSGGSAFAGGYLDEVAVWNRTLTNAEILTLYQKQKWALNNTIGPISNTTINVEGVRFDKGTWNGSITTSSLAGHGVSELTNDAGYITSGCATTDTSYVCDSPNSNYCDSWRQVTFCTS